ncbi:MAG: PepSY domain-containing protein [Proteobacteria bacterium]|nr:PepSY domain-containing protein [Pseudomonadota bacterium]
MNKKLFIRKVHRYIGLIVSLQLLAWAIGGVWFAWNDINKIRGNHLKKAPTVTSYQQNLISPQLAINNLSDFNTLKSITVVTILNEPVYTIIYTSNDNSSKTTLVNANNGMLITDFNQQQAINIAKMHASFDAEIATVELLTETSKHHEYRAKPLPAWAITFDYPSSPTFYVASKLGVVTSVRHTSWRIFDLLWMLHTMDYQGRDDFGNWLIKLFSIIALITAISGILLFVISYKRVKPKC